MGMGGGVLLTSHAASIGRKVSRLRQGSLSNTIFITTKKLSIRYSKLVPMKENVSAWYTRTNMLASTQSAERKKYLFITLVRNQCWCFQERNA